MRRVPSGKVVRVALSLVALAGVVVGLMTTGDAGAAKTSPAPDRLVTTIVLPGEILAGQDTTSFPFTTTRPPTEGTGSYVVPADKRLVIESAYVTVEEQFTDPIDHRTGLYASLVAFYETGGTCAFPGYERDYAFGLDPAVVRSDESLQGGNIEGPIYVEGERTLAMGAATATTTQSIMVVEVVVHGYLEPAVNPSVPTFECS